MPLFIVELIHTEMNYCQLLAMVKQVWKPYALFARLG